MDEFHALRTEIRTFLHDYFGDTLPIVDGWHHGFDADFSRALAERGWVGMRVPERYGGSDRTPVERFVVNEELLAVGAPVGAHWVGDRQLAPLLLHLGTEEQRETFLPLISQAAVSFVIGLSEPNAGSDLAAIATRGERVDGGWRVTGTKVWTSHASYADYANVLCRTTPGSTRHEGLSQLLVDLRAPGVQVLPIETMAGHASFAEIVLDEVLVPDAFVLGEIGNGWHQAMTELSFERAGSERYLSTLSLLQEVARTLEHCAPTADAVVGELLAELATLRTHAYGIAAAGSSVGLDGAAAIVKEAGPELEQRLIERVRYLWALEPSARNSQRLGQMLREASLSAPGFTLRGGTTEIMRSIIAKQVVAHG